MDTKLRSKNGPSDPGISCFREGVFTLLSAAINICISITIITIMLIMLMLMLTCDSGHQLIIVSSISIGQTDRSDVGIRGPVNL